MRLTEAELATMRAEHVNDGGACPKCWGYVERHDEICCVDWPCSTARLLAQFAPGPVPHLAGIATVHSDEAARKEFGDGVGAGLCGPSCSEELV